jgi:hypothetical protein
MALAALGAHADSYYALQDFASVEKIDAHVHLHGMAQAFMEQARRDGVRVLTINVDYPDFPPLYVQQRDASNLKARYPGQVAFATTFSVAGFGTPEWLERTQLRLKDAIAQGAVGVKVWKNIGLELRDGERYVMIDDVRFKPIFDELERQHLVLLGHQAEPLNCWLPFGRMTIRSDRDYFREHPQYYMYRHPEVPDHARQLAARDHVLAAHPALKFDAVHLASLEWDVDKIAAFLDRFPNASVDVAARMSHLEYQSVVHRDKVRRFFIRYQSRMLYGTDMALLPRDSDADVAAEAHRTWLADWQFLTGETRLKSDEFSGSFKALKLPKTVIDRIYAQNARQLFPGAWSGR